MGLILESGRRRAWQTHSSILSWRIPWTEEPGRLQSIGLQRVPHIGSSLHTCMWVGLPWLSLGCQRWFFPWELPQFPVYTDVTCTDRVHECYLLTPLAPFKAEHFNGKGWAHPPLIVWGLAQNQPVVCGIELTLRSLRGDWDGNIRHSCGQFSCGGTYSAERLCLSAGFCVPLLCVHEFWQMSILHPCKHHLTENLQHFLTPKSSFAVITSHPKPQPEIITNLLSLQVSFACSKTL